MVESSNSESTNPFSNGYWGTSPYPKIFFKGKFMSNNTTVNNTNWTYFSAQQWMREHLLYDDWEALIKYRTNNDPTATFELWNSYGDNSWKFEDMIVSGV